MVLADIINQIRNLSRRDQQRLKEFFTNSLGSAAETESVFKDVSEQKHKDGYTCTHCQSTNVIRFGKYQVKTTINTIERQRYRCKECCKTFTDMTNTPLHRTHMPSKWLQFIECMIEGYSLRKSAKLIGAHYVTLFYWRHKILTAFLNFLKA